MENLSEEGRALLTALRQEAAASATDLESRLTSAIEAAVHTSVTAAVKDMRVYTDGAEHELRNEIADLRATLDPASPTGDAPPCRREELNPARMGTVLHHRHGGWNAQPARCIFLLRQEVYAKIHQILPSISTIETAVLPHLLATNYPSWIFLASRVKIPSSGKLGVRITS
jgi:hypothetical protein